MNRRGFLQACLVACAAPAIARASSLMKMVPTESGLIVPDTQIVGWKVYTEAVELNEAWIAFVHPSLAEDIARMVCSPPVVMRPGEYYLGDVPGVRFITAAEVYKAPEEIEPAPLPSSLTLDLIRAATRRLRANA